MVRFLSTPSFASTGYFTQSTHTTLNTPQRFRFLLPSLKCSGVECGHYFGLKTSIAPSMYMRKDGQDNDVLTHIPSVGRFRASRDVPLPYEVSGSVDQDRLHADLSIREHEGLMTSHDIESQAPVPHEESMNLAPTRSHTSGANIEPATGSGETRQRRKTGTSESPVVRAFSRMGTLLHSAHAQDFERRRRPELGQAIGKDIREDDVDDDDDDEVSTDSEAEAVGAALKRQQLQGPDTEAANDGNDNNDGEGLSDDVVNGTVRVRRAQMGDEIVSGDDAVSDVQHMPDDGHERG